jgi:AraC-like DNA-binding protein
MLYIGGITITFFLAIILASKKDKNNADRILALWLTITGLHLLLYYLLISRKYFDFPFLLGVEIPLPLLHGPFLFLYTTALTSQNNFKKKYLPHFIPFLLATVFLLPFFALSSSQKIEVYQHEGKEYDRLMRIIFGAIIISGFAYILLSLHKLSKHRKNIKEQFSYTDKINLRWLFYLILGLSAIWAFVIFRNDTYVFSAVVCYVIFIGYFGIKQVGIFTNKNPDIEIDKSEDNLPIEPDTLQDFENPALPNVTEVEKVKYQKSRIRAEDIDSIHQSLTLLMQQEKTFKDPELTLADAAQKLNVHPNTLSQVINSVEQKNFYDYINFQRVEEFKQLIANIDNQKYTLLSLAFESGFNSKTSFNRNFKKATGLSPTEFLA